MQEFEDAHQQPPTPNDQEWTAALEKQNEEPFEQIERFKDSLPGVAFKIISFETFLEALKVSKEKGQLEVVKEWFGSLSVYCIAGIMRSPAVGEMLNKLGFKFAAAETVRGAAIADLGIKLRELKIEENKFISPQTKRPIDSIIVLVDLAKPREVENIEIFLSKVEYISEKTGIPLQFNFLIVDGSDVQAGLEMTRKRIQQTFPELKIGENPSYIKPW